MTEIANWSMAINITQGPSLELGGTFDIDAYSKSSVTIDNGAVQAINISAASTEVSLLFVRASAYGNMANPAEALLYRVNGQQVASDVIMAAPIFLLGASGVKLLHDNLQSLTFTNNTGAPVTIDIIVGMDVTP